jgi:hypothetical protein
MKTTIENTSKRNNMQLQRLLISLILIIGLSACSGKSAGADDRAKMTGTPISTPTITSTPERTFLNLTLAYLDEYRLSKEKFQDTVVGGLSGITFDAATNKFYAVSDDRAFFAPARFYTLDIALQENAGQVGFDKITVDEVAILKNQEGENYPQGSIDPEAIALSPRGTVYLSSEGDRKLDINPFIGEFELKTGQLRDYLPIPQRYLIDKTNNTGIQNNLAFENLTIKTNGTAADDPFRVFVATESSLIQDQDLDRASPGSKIRLMHYSIQPFGMPVLVSEQLYLLDPPAPDTIAYGLSEILALDREGYFLTMERSRGLTGFNVKIFQVAAGTAQDIANTASLAGDTKSIRPLTKQLLLDLGQLDLDLDNLEGMTFGPRLPDGSRSLLLVSDDNFKEEQFNQFLLFRLSEEKKSQSETPR